MNPNFAGAKSGIKQARFLILRGGAIGDFIATLPAIRAVRDRWPEAWIELVGYPHIADLALAAGLVNRVESLDRSGMARFFADRPAFTAEQSDYIRSFDFVISYLHDPGGMVRNNLELAGARQVLYGSPIVETGHAVDHLLKPLEALAIYGDGTERPRLDIPDAPALGREWLTRNALTSRPVAIHPGSGSPKKNWPADRFLHLARMAADRLGVAPFFILGEADAAVAEALGARAGGFPVLTGVSLVRLAAILSVCRAFAGNDSGITHLAAAVGLPVVALFGPSDASRWAPRGPCVRVLRGEGGDMTAIADETVLAALAEVLIEAGRGP